MTNQLASIYWHRDLPPLDAEPEGEYSVDAASVRVDGTIAHRDELWDQCYADLMRHTRERIDQEIIRLGGRYAHVTDESIAPHRNDAANQTWLQGDFKFVLYK